MTQSKSIDELSAEELFALAEQRQRQEEEHQREALKEKLRELKAKRRELVSAHRRELAGLDGEIERLGGRRPSHRRKGVSPSREVLAIVEQAGEISTREIRAQLEERGVTAKNLGQTLAYLKRRGRVVSPSRSRYAPA